MKTTKDSSDFLFGVGTSAHQIEGDNIHSDWWHFEQEYTGGISSGKACNSYELYKDDARIIKNLGCNTYRFSIEWARIEPVQGQFDDQAMKHYVDQIDDLISLGIEPMITLHHFTNPLWFELLGGWESTQTIELFNRYVEYVLLHIADKVKYYVTINEPNIYVSAKYLTGVWHPGAYSVRKAFRVISNMLSAHKNVYTLIKRYRADSQVGFSINHAIFIPKKNLWYPLNWLLCKFLYLASDYYGYNVTWRKYLDFIGLNYYTRQRVTLSTAKGIEVDTDPAFFLDKRMHFLQYPEDLLTALRQLKTYDLPIYITENGVLSDNDNIRADYLRKIFPLMKQAISEGINLKGYYHWSLLDNFEWSFGYEPKFGLFEVDEHTFLRTPKPSSQVYKELISSW